LKQFNTAEDKNTKAGQEVAELVKSGELSKVEAEKVLTEKDWSKIFKHQIKEVTDADIKDIRSTANSTFKEMSKSAKYGGNVNKAKRDWYISIRNSLLEKNLITTEQDKKIKKLYNIKLKFQVAEIEENKMNELTLLVNERERLKKELSYEREKEMEIYYNNEMVGTRRIDFLVEDKVIVELKAQAKLDDVHLVQGKNYLKVFNLEVGLLINFGSASLETKRLFK